LEEPGAKNPRKLKVKFLKSKPMENTPEEEKVNFLLLKSFGHLHDDDDEDDEKAANKN
jgi:hypothetical protein